jgi:uncharacterized protein YegP (UPF0339 family)
MPQQQHPVPRFDVKRNRLTGRYRFNLVAANGKVIGSSQRYRSFDACLDGIASVRANAPAAVTLTGR